MMKKRSSLYFGILAVALAVIMIGATIVSASASSATISQEEIDKIVNTATDASQITSPFLEVTEKVRNSVVGVNNYTTSTSYYGYGYGYGYGQPETRESLQGTGSGVVVTPYGHVLTNYHVVEGATRVTITTGVDDQEHEATVVCYDANLDIAVLEVPGLDLPAVELGDSDQLQVGEWAIVIGNPLGESYARTVSVGVISGLNREVTDRTMDRYGRMSTITNTMIQTDAAINSGNSGGGMFNTLGQLQGIPARYANSTGSSSIFFSTGRDVDNIGLCIPINVAKPLITEALQNYNSGKTASSGTDNQSRQQRSNGQGGDLYGRPRAGISISTLSNVSAYGLPQGALIRVVEEKSPAEEAGLQVGDIIVEVDGQVISSSADFTAKVGQCGDGDTLTIKVYRDAELARQITQNALTMEGVGNGEYLEVTITLRVIDNIDS
ncbi:MAG: trypsin-like peptidase domain-containing protein [Clostridia bacterium]|nr:trypsin-like peptidase domain-containing protein [Clostridia bacterium]